jgi:hypothetical protein
MSKSCGCLPPVFPMDITFGSQKGLGANASDSNQLRREQQADGQ